MCRTPLPAIFALVLCCSLAPWTAAAEDTPATRPAEFFDTSQLHTFHIHVSAEAWQKMEPTRVPRLGGLLGGGRRAAMAPATAPTTPPATQPAAAGKRAGEGERLPPGPFGYQYAYVRGIIEFEGETFRDVAIRFKGNSSYQTSASGLKRPFKVDFDRFVDGREFHGLSTLNFNNNAMDPSQIREALSYALFREAGVPSPRTTFAVLYLTVDGKYDHICLGLYTIVEEVDKRFLRSHFDSAKGLLLKPEGIRGLPHLGEDWAKYEKYGQKTDPTPETSRRFIDFTRVVNTADDANFRQQIGSYLDIDAYARFLAANVLLANLDSFLSTGHNYYMYIEPEGGRIDWVPWDLNLSLGSLSLVGSGEDQMGLSVAQPYVSPNRLLERLFAMDEFARPYRGYLKDFMTTCFAPKKIDGQIEAFERIVQQAEQLAHDAKSRAPAMAAAGRGILRAAPDVKTFFARRVESVSAQLDGKAEGYVPAFMRGPFAGASNLPAVLGAALLRNLDTDRDKSLSVDELSSAIRAFYKTTDSESKGTLDERTFAEALERIVPSDAVPQRAMVIERRAEAMQKRAAVQLAGLLMKQADADKDGRLTLSELLTAAQLQFREADRDKNDLLSGGEIMTALTRLLAPLPNER